MLPRPYLSEHAEIEYFGSSLSTVILSNEVPARGGNLLAPIVPLGGRSKYFLTTSKRQDPIPGYPLASPIPLLNRVACG